METPYCPDVLKIVDLPEPPYAINPETGLAETIGRGRVAVMGLDSTGKPAVASLVELAEPYTNKADTGPDTLSELVATGKLHNN